MRQSPVAILVSAASCFSKKLCKLIFVCLSLLSTGCTIISVATDGLTEANREFIIRNEREVNFSLDSIVEADYQGVKDAAFVYRLTDRTGQKAFVQLPSQTGQDAHLTFVNPIDSTDVVRPARFIIYNDRHDLCLEHRKNSSISEAAVYPTSVCMYVTQSGRTKAGGEYQHSTYFNSYEYENRDGSLIKGSVEKSGLSASDSFLLGLRNFGYFITVPIDTALTFMFIPFSPFVGCAPIWGCP